MTWTTISNAAVAVGAIPSSSLATAFRDNPVAIAGALSGAPIDVNSWHPVDKASIGDGKTGLLYDHSVTGNVSEVETPNFEDGYEYRIVGDNLSHESGSSRALIVDCYKETSAAYDGGVSTFTLPNTTFAGFDWQISFPRISMVAHPMHFIGYYNLTLLSPLTNFTAGDAALYDSTPEKILKARVRYSAGNIDSGKIWLFRRREYASSP